LREISSFTFCSTYYVPRWKIRWLLAPSSITVILYTKMASVSDLFGVLELSEPCALQIVHQVWKVVLEGAFTG
jgi:hypothetical protein